jgi:uncharacterized protein YndB with AHSA1/START domain
MLSEEENKPGALGQRRCRDEFYRVKGSQMNRSFIVKASTIISAPAAIVWGALTKPNIIKQYMFGTNVVSDWKQGSPIVWKGEWQGRSYEDKGQVLEVVEDRLLRYSHFSPLSGKPDAPENYHTVTIELESRGDQTIVTLSQDNNETAEDRDHSERNWQTMLNELKTLLETYLSENPSCRVEDIDK